MTKKSNLRILYEDEFVIVVFKEAGVLSQKNKFDTVSLNDMVLDYLKNTYCSDYVGLLHRLDRPVAGPIMFAKTKQSARLFSKQFKDNKIFKKYYAIVFGKTNDAERLEAFLDDKTDNVQISKELKLNFKPAILEYKLIKTLKMNTIDIFDNYLSLLDIKLITGRKHQIRAQLANIGHPILSDIKYFNINNNFNEAELKLMSDSTFLDRGHLALFCYYLSFNHSLKSGKRVEIILDYPQNWPKNFSQQ